ncbi:HlyD family secretion protein [Actinobacillus equuli]|uniref:HlyD family secretion protein n=1 Tax=Actinobacillus equuli TaxID=718 RepID=UPI002442D02D|nr:HlyD family efflux transporter periplasmic adaptor subunit [Actinobacillus equuli]WGE41429.1 HlyD family secretion protein [Actinobacillus equuli subsp. haemolyticus]
MFRQEALENQRWKSSAVLFSRVPGWLVSSVSFLMLAIFILYISFGSYTRRENVLGEVVMQPHPIILSSPKSGYISDVYAAVNQEVRKDQPLFKIRLERITDSGNIDTNAINFVKAQISEIKQIIDKLKINKLETVNNINKQIENNHKIKKEVIVYLNEIEKGIHRYYDLYRRYLKLQQQGDASNDEVSSQYTYYLSYKESQNEVKAQLTQIESTILNLQNEIDSKKIDFDNQIIRYEIQISDLKIRLMELESVYEIIVNSPTDGVVESTSVTVGQIIKEGDPLSQIIPAKKGKYQLVMWVPNSAISFVKKNDDINIRYEAFPFEKFGQFKGKIEHISTLPASLQELAFYKNVPTNNDPNNPLYKIVVSIQDQKINYNNTELHFLAGMKAEATLFLESRRLYEWMLLPLYRLNKNKEKI